MALPMTDRFFHRAEIARPGEWNRSTPRPERLPARVLAQADCRLFARCRSKCRTVTVGSESTTGSRLVFAGCAAPGARGCGCGRARGFDGPRSRNRTVIFGMDVQKQPNRYDEDHGDRTQYRKQHQAGRNRGDFLDRFSRNFPRLDLRLVRFSESAGQQAARVLPGRSGAGGGAKAGCFSGGSSSMSEKLGLRAALELSPPSSDPPSRSENGILAASWLAWRAIQPLPVAESNFFLSIYLRVFVGSRSGAFPNLPRVRSRRPNRLPNRNSRSILLWTNAATSAAAALATAALSAARWAAVGLAGSGVLSPDEGESALAADTNFLATARRVAVSNLTLAAIFSLVSGPIFLRRSPCSSPDPPAVHALSGNAPLDPSPAPS